MVSWGAGKLIEGAPVLQWAAHGLSLLPMDFAAAEIAIVGALQSALLGGWWRICLRLQR